MEHPKLAYAPELLNDILSESTPQLPRLHPVALWPQPWEVLSQLWRAKLHRAEAGVTRAFVWFLFPRALGLSHSDFPLTGSVFSRCFSLCWSARNF